MWKMSFRDHMEDCLRLAERTENPAQRLILIQAAQTFQQAAIRAERALKKELLDKSPDRGL
jgi:hypothetical protein